MHKDISIDSITAGTQKPSTNLIPKKNNLFRCHSVKIKGPTKKTWNGIIAKSIISIDLFIYII